MTGSRKKKIKTEVTSSIYNKQAKKQNTHKSCPDK